MSSRNTRRDYHGKTQLRQARRRNSSVAAKLSRGDQPKSRRGVASRNLALPFSPPEDWYEPAEDGRAYRVLRQDPGHGYRHVVTESDVRTRLDKLPGEFLRDLEVVQLSQMTRKKQSLPCYGMQWGATLYLYPIDETLKEQFFQPPSPAVLTETKMYGGRWSTPEPGVWTLTWSKNAIRDFYLNNILIHELGHLLDERNSSYTERERFAEWFAIEFGYRRTRPIRPSSRKPFRRRHHSV